MKNDRTPNPHVPPLVADAFVASMRDRDFQLEYSQTSLDDILDKILDLPLLRSDTAVTIQIEGNDVHFDLESAASAYLGETLKRLFNGTWAGYFDPKSGVNFYTSRVEFGAYFLHPICWLSYRLSNGREEGSVTEWLARVTPSIKARKDLTPQSGFIKDIY